MAVTTAPTASITTTEPRTAPSWRTGIRTGLLAAAASTAVAALALAADVPLEVDGEQIPLAGFAQLTLVATVVGVLLAKALARWSARPRTTFTATTVALTGLSFVPDLVVDATSTTKAVLIATHVAAAAIVIPALAARLPERNR
jgi:Family of unknown function (DUF6069)